MKLKKRWKHSSKINFDQRDTRRWYLKEHILSNWITTIFSFYKEDSQRRIPHYPCSLGILHPKSPHTYLHRPCSPGDPAPHLRHIYPHSTCIMGDLTPHLSHTYLHVRIIMIGIMRTTMRGRTRTITRGRIALHIRVSMRLLMKDTIFGPVENCKFLIYTF